MTHANYITIGRIVLVPLVLIVLLTELQNREIIAFVIFVIAALTDAIDGFVARRFNQISNLGKFLDPLADKLLVSGVLIALVYLREVDSLAAAIIILREILISALRWTFLLKNNSFSASVMAKLKTTFQVLALAVIIIHEQTPFPDFFEIVGIVLLYISIFLSVYSAAEYLIKYNRFFRES
jgi:CDP-diacylglycerol---glycerol-3-phosphate 3-phosphatidyltransferase